MTMTDSTPKKISAHRADKNREYALRSAARTARSKAREFSVQALYQHLVGQQSPQELDAHTRNLQGFGKADAAHFDALVHGCIERAQDYDALIAPHLDRPWNEISPCEHAILWLGVYELQYSLDVPWRVVLNEYIEQAKAFGGTDGHKYVNGVLNKIAPLLRKTEMDAEKSTTPSPSDSNL